MYNFDALKVKNQCVEWIRSFFEENGKGCNAVVGISGGKDSSIVAALCVEALGKDRVIGVLMPCGEQHDIDCAKQLVDHLGIKNYTVNIKDTVDGLMKNGVIIRHLVLPNEVENTFKVLDWINEHLGPNTYISIMGQYTPCYKAKDMTKYNRTLHNIEYKRVLNKINSLGFNNGFIQDLNSASDNFIPDFNKFED